MNDREKAKWLEAFAALLESNPHAFMTYTTSDDGVWLSFGPREGDEINVGFNRESALEAIHTRASWLKVVR